MGILDELLGGGQRQKEYGDFVKRYEQGDPSEGYSDQEVLNRYGEVSHAVSPDQYAQAAQEALSKLSPEERAAFVKVLQDRAAARGVTLPRQVAPEPKELGQVLTDLHGKPGQLRDMLGWEDGPCRLIMYLATISPQHKPAGQSNNDEAIEPHHASTANCSNSDLRSRSRASRPVHTDRF